MINKKLTPKDILDFMSEIFSDSKPNSKKEPHQIFIISTKEEVVSLVRNEISKHLECDRKMREHDDNFIKENISCITDIVTLAEVVAGAKETNTWSDNKIYQVYLEQFEPESILEWNGKKYLIGDFELLEEDATLEEILFYFDRVVRRDGGYLSITFYDDMKVDIQNPSMMPVWSHADWKNKDIKEIILNDFKDYIKKQNTRLLGI
jgi:hypothetical protein